MTRNTRGGDAAATPASTFELGCRDAYLRMSNVTERVQLAVVATLLVAVVGTVSIAVLSMARSSHE
ncbi:hypothetical protein ACIQVO_30350 [Streptomyces sp. NPDC101062]|uniref:hypothetical protein n=1 Tax=unclassified Streptomyces TaxID=2593676 RepID=UPI002E7747C3|nr:hypothetical protein [Streptomyces sp. JV176]MEE1799798.1 hypothetical protein [Streptomyces sp. JV176]